MAVHVEYTARERRLFDVLRGVSRAFYLTLRVLPRDLRRPIGLAYLLARAADTMADTKALSPEDRLDSLLRFRQAVETGAGPEAIQPIVDSLAVQQPTETERRLLACLPEAFDVLNVLETTDAVIVRAIVVELTRGMELDLTTFPSEDSGGVKALEGWDALDEYAYLVAGCVGEFWTAITMDHAAALEGWDRHGMAELGVRFGKALQLTNILRDVPSDLRIGRCYLPGPSLAEVGLRPSDLLDPLAADAARPVLVEGVRIALDHYGAAFEYMLAIPRRCVRLRLAAAWPILIGLGTLASLAANPVWLDPSRRSRVSRGWVYRMIGVSLFGVCSNSFMRGWLERLRAKVERAL